METSIPALLVAAIMMIATVVMARSGYSSVDQLGQSWQGMEQRLEEQARTRLTAVEAIVDSSHANITVRFQNDGQTALADWSRMDVVVEYFSEDSTRYARWIPYTSGDLISNTWTLVNIENDSFQPGVLNPGEIAELRIRINPVMGTGTNAWVIVSTDTGVTISASVSG
jgi:archaellum component FlaF (FlaF/FlaG flagellin family)